MEIKTKVENDKIIIEIPKEFLNESEDGDIVSLRILDVFKMLYWIKYKMFYCAYENGESWLEGVVPHFDDEDDEDDEK